MTPDLNSLVVFASVVNNGGISAAARALNLPKSNISRRVSQLEDRLGVRLLERTTRKINPTEIGEIYYRHCQHIVDEIEHANHSIERAMDVPRGTLRVSASISTGQNLINPVLGEFIKAYPDIKVVLQLSNRRVDLIEEGFDLAIRVGPLEDSSLISRLLCESELGVYASIDYVKSRGLLEDPDDLANADCLVMSDKDDEPAWTLMSSTTKRTIKIEPAAIVNDFSALRQLVMSGAGVALLPDYVAKTGNETPVRILPDWSVPSVAFHAIYPSHRGATPKMRAFLDWLIEKLAITNKT